jgi:hypothetical protein
MGLNFENLYSRNTIGFTAGNHCALYDVITVAASR